MKRTVFLYVGHESAGPPQTHISRMILIVRSKAQKSTSGCEKDAGSTRRPWQRHLKKAKQGWRTIGLAHHRVGAPSGWRTTGLFRPQQNVYESSGINTISSPQGNKTMNGLRWFVILGVLSIISTGCKQKKAKPIPPRKRVVKRKGPEKTLLPRGVKVFPQEVMVQVYPFQMGSDDTSLPGSKMEAPRHKVQLNNVFAIWRKEVTQEEFRQMMGYNPSHFSKCGSNCPVERVSWHEAAFYCNRLSQKYNLSRCYRCNNKFRKAICDVDPSFRGKRYYQCNGFRLPTESEWEYAARAGSTGSFYKIPILKGKMVATVNRIAWHGTNSQVSYPKSFRCAEGSENDRCGTHPVGQKVPNTFGLYDMIGNVSEWVYDRFGKYPSARQTNPIGPKSGPRVFRGCSWFHNQRECRISRRFRSSPSLRNNLVGFRPARTLVRAKQAKQ